MTPSTTASPSDVTAPKRTFFGTRVFSIAALCATVSGLGYVANTGYRVATDSFVVPVVLSPDSDLVIASKLSRAAIMNEQARIAGKKEEIDAELYAAEQAIEQLKALHAASSKALEWTSAVTATQATAGGADLRALGRQHEEITSMIAAQEAFVKQTKKDLDAGLVSKADFSREEHALGPMRVAAIDNERARLMTEGQMSQVRLTREAISGERGKGRLSTPEMLLQQDQLVRIQCDILKLEAERRAKTSERRHIDEEIAKIDELVAQLNRRPIFRAIDASTNVAFIPYSQLDGVAVGGSVLECVWGTFACTSVGRVTEVLPGEVIVPDPWGSLARGQYAVIALDDQHAAQSKTLRVRSAGTKAAPLPSNPATPSFASK